MSTHTVGFGFVISPHFLLIARSACLAALFALPQPGPARNPRAGGA